MHKVTAMMVAFLSVTLWSQPQTVVLQNGLNGYEGCTDKELRDPSRNYSRGPRDTILEVSEI